MSRKSLPTRMGQFSPKTSKTINLCPLFFISAIVQKPRRHQLRRVPGAVTQAPGDGHHQAARELHRRVRLHGANVRLDRPEVGEA